MGNRGQFKLVSLQRQRKGKAYYILLSSCLFFNFNSLAAASGLSDLIYGQNKPAKAQNTYVETPSRLNNQVEFADKVNSNNVTWDNFKPFARDELTTYNSVLSDNILSSDDKAMDKPKALKEVSILLLGDMFTTPLKNGLARVVNFDETPFSFVEASNYNAHLLNFSAQDILKDVRSVLDKYKPTFVVITIGSADILKLQRELSNVSLFKSSWQETYEQKLNTLVKPLLERAIPFAIVGTLPYPAEGASYISKSINEIHKKTAEKYRMSFINIWNNFSNDFGEFSEMGFTSEGKVAKLRYNNTSSFTVDGENTLAYYVSKDLTNRFYPAPLNVAKKDEAKQDSKIVTAQATASGLWNTDKSEYIAQPTKKSSNKVIDQAPYGRVDNNFISENATQLAQEAKDKNGLVATSLDEEIKKIPTVSIFNNNSPEVKEKAITIVPSSKKAATNANNNESTKPQSQKFYQPAELYYKPKAKNIVTETKQSNSERKTTAGAENNSASKAKKETQTFNSNRAVKPLRQKNFKKDLSTLPMNGLY